MYNWPILLLALLLLAPIPAAARDTETIRVAESSAAADFPNAITFNLRAESSDADIAAIQLLYGATRDEALVVVDLAAPGGRAAAVSHRLDTQVYYYPPGTAITYRWRIVDAAGNVLESEPQELLYHDTRFPWRELSARNVTVLWYDGDDRFGQELLDTATGSLDRLQTEIGAQLDLPVRIYIYGALEDMRGALAANSAEWIGGQASPELGVIVGTIEPGNSAEVLRLIPHELSHQVLHQATANPYGGTPVWFDEGLAVYNEASDAGYYAEVVAEAARTGRLIPLEALAASFPADPEQTTLSYAQSREVVAFIAATHGPEKLGELARAFAAATPLEEALRTTLGQGVDDLDAAWRATLPRIGPQPTPQPGPPAAPDDRFSEPPVLPAQQAPQPVPATPAPAPDPLQAASDQAAAWVVGLPPWVSLGAMALCCVSLLMVAGSALLVGLRLLGVDKRT